MITISVCMIVKNESRILARCLDSLKGLWDELIIVDTGSTDDTMDIARGYTDMVYSFEWTGDFSEARNYALDRATCEYIYSADADEILEGEEKNKFRALKECLDPEVDVVQMYYGNQLDNGTVYNFDKELRPKLFKRVRPVRFTEPIHETLKLDPVIFDSDIVITHKPENQHGSRDLAAFKRLTEAGGSLSHRLKGFLFRELYMQGTEADLADFAGYLKNVTESEDSTEDEITEACVLLTGYYRKTGDHVAMLECALKVVAMGSNSEVCDELGQYYLDKNDPCNASIWFFNAYNECQPVFSIKAGHDIPLKGLADAYAALGDMENAEYYRGLI